ncbi:hypothetical protein [Nonomuraea sp. NPDC050691]|uniref:hypothetical protein n=1 Tax=Nonomuraea sp. NPDC050691 TaxID=3155661 RepID=UPI0033E36218
MDRELTPYRVRKLTEQALRPGGGFRARRAAARLCRPETVCLSHTSAHVEQLVHLLRSAPDPEMADQAARTLADPRVSGDPKLLAWTVTTLTNRPYSYGRLDGELSGRVLDFLLGPEVGPSRLETCLAGSGSLLHPRQSAASVGFWFIKAACTAEDDEVRARAGAFLSRTGQPHLLRALEETVLAAVGDRFRLMFSYAVDAVWKQRPILWDDDGEPSPLLRLHLANPHLPLRPGEKTPLPGHVQAHNGPLLAVLAQREDLIADYLAVHGPKVTVDSLFEGAAQRVSPDGFAAACRGALRALPVGPARERLCQKAARDYRDVGRAIVRETGWVWGDDEAAFCWFTEQWERYDALDPDGARLRAYGRTHRDDDDLFYRAKKIAKKTSRPNPFPPRPDPDRTPTSPRNRGPIGGWATSYGAGGFSTH